MFNLVKKLKKTIAGLLLASLISFQLLASGIQSTKAVPVIATVPVMEGMQLQELIQKIVLSILSTALKSLMTRALINQAGEPTIVGNWADYLRQSGVDVSLDWLDDKFFNSQLCSHIRPQLQLPLYAIATGEATEFKADCSLTKFLDNIDETFDYLESGDWLVFEEVLLPQNNEVGFYLSSASEIMTIQDQTVQIELAQLETNEGFVSAKDEEGNVTTTGKAKYDTWKSIYIDLPIGNILEIDPDDLLAGDFSAFLDWGVNLLLNKVYREGMTRAKNLGNDI